MSHGSLGDLARVRAALSDLPNVDPVAVAAAEERNAQLTKPPKALGQLEEAAIWYAGWRGTAKPVIAAPQVVIFAGNHGVAARGVSAFPPEVTVQMVANFNAGGAAVNQLARTVGAKLDVIALELDRPTEDFTQAAAMTEDDLCAALGAGWDAVDPDADLLVTGEMGIGNTTSAAAIAAALFGGGAEEWTGRGTGVDDAALRAKTAIVQEGLDRHPQAIGDGLEALRCFGGRELAAMAGAILRARHLRIPVILDGFICCAAASALEKAQPGALEHTIAGHLSSETAHRRMLDELGKAPLLSLGMRLGEGSGGTLAIGVLQGAVNCLSGMATFAEAGVSGS